MSDSSYQSMAQDSQQRVADLESRLEAAEKLIRLLPELHIHGFDSQEDADAWNQAADEWEALADYEKAKEPKP